MAQSRSAYARRYYRAKKQDPEFVEKRREAVRRFKREHANDPYYKLLRSISIEIRTKRQSIDRYLARIERYEKAIFALIAEREELKRHHKASTSPVSVKSS